LKIKTPAGTIKIKDRDLPTTPWLVITKNFVVSDRPGRKLMTAMVNDGWTVENETKTAFTRATTVTWKKPNPHFADPSA